jgi:hypothetical protein
MTRPNLYDILKVLALTCMVIDHVGYFFYPELMWLRRVGRFAFPIFLFLVGYNHSFRRRWSLWIWAILVQVVLWVWVQQWLGTYGAYGGVVWLNILVAIALTRVLLGLVSKLPWWVVGLFLVWWVLLPYLHTSVEYGTMNIVWACIGYRVRDLTSSSESHKNEGSIGRRSLAWWLIAVWLIGQRWLTETYFGWEYTLVTRNVLGIGLVLWTMIYGNRAVWFPQYIKQSVLRLSKHALPLYAIHILILYLLSQVV